jgi:hypothetical protein
VEIPLVIDNFTQVKHTILYWFQVNKIYEWVDILGKEYMNEYNFFNVSIYDWGVFSNSQLHPCTPNYQKRPPCSYLWAVTASSSQDFVRGKTSTVSILCQFKYIINMSPTQGVFRIRCPLETNHAALCWTISS